MKYFIHTFLFLSIVLSTRAQNHGALPNKPFIEVTGSSETEIVPDEIYIQITLQERMDAKEKISIEKQETDLKNGLKEIGLDVSAALSLNNANSDYRRIKSFKKDVVISKNYMLKVSTGEQVDKVYKVLDVINAHDAYIAKLSHSKITEFAKENRIKAIKAAKDKAEYLLAAVGNSAGAPVSITETANNVDNQPYYYNNRYMANVAQSYSGSLREFSDSDSQEEAVSIRKIKLKASFLVKYEIK